MNERLSDKLDKKTFGKLSIAEQLEVIEQLICILRCLIAFNKFMNKLEKLS